jgi:hypothetical protein
MGIGRRQVRRQCVYSQRGDSTGVFMRSLRQTWGRFFLDSIASICFEFAIVKSLALTISSPANFQLSKTNSLFCSTAKLKANSLTESQTLSSQIVELAIAECRVSAVTQCFTVVSVYTVLRQWDPAGFVGLWPASAAKTKLASQSHSRKECMARLTSVADCGSCRVGVSAVGYLRLLFNLRVESSFISTITKAHCVQLPAPSSPATRVLQEYNTGYKLDVMDYRTTEVSLLYHERPVVHQSALRNSSIDYGNYFSDCLEMCEFLLLPVYSVVGRRKPVLLYRHWTSYV